MLYQAEKPYPKPKAEKENIKYAQILLQSYAGKISEETASHLYIYQHMIENENYQELADALLHIAIVEMHHLKLLGETIKLLGLTPKFRTIEASSGYEIPWNTNYINSSTNVEEIIKFDIESETTAIENYLKYQQEIKDKYIKDLISRILEDEYLHLKIFYYFQEKLKILE